MTLSFPYLRNVELFCLLDSTHLSALLGKNVSRKKITSQNKQNKSPPPPPTPKKGRYGVIDSRNCKLQISRVICPNWLFSFFPLQKTWTVLTGNPPFEEVYLCVTVQYRNQSVFILNMAVNNTQPLKTVPGWLFFKSQTRPKCCQPFWYFRSIFVT